MATACLRWNPLQLAASSKCRSVQARAGPSAPHTAAVQSFVRLHASPLRRRRCRTRTSALSFYAEEALNQGLGSGSQLLTFCGVAALAYYLANQSSTPKDPRGECPRCSGTGKEACFCSKWSDGDVGCASCEYTGLVRCKACGGGGNAVPIALRIRVDEGIPQKGGQNGRQQ